MLDFSFIQTVGDIYIFITNSELDSDNCLLNTKLLFIDLTNVNGKIGKKIVESFSLIS